MQWEESNSLTLIHDAKLPNSFNSARWKKGYNANLIFSSSNIDNMSVKSVLNHIARTQHRTLCVTVNHVLVSRSTAFRRRFNLRKANWSGYATDADILIVEVDPPTPDNYERLVEVIRVTSRKPRGPLHCAHLHHTLAALKRDFPASFVAPLPNSEQTNLPSSNHTYTKSTTKHIHHHYAPSITSIHTTHIISSAAPTYTPHCHPWICGQIPPV